MPPKYNMKLYFITQLSLLLKRARWYLEIITIAMLTQEYFNTIKQYMPCS